MKTIAERIRKTSCELIVKEISQKGFSNVARPENVILKVKSVLGIDLKETEAGKLIFA